MQRQWTIGRVSAAAQRDTVQRFIPPPPSVAILLLLGLLSGCATTDPNNTGIGSAPAGEITVTITSPKPTDSGPPVIFGDTVVKGTFSATTGIKVTKIEGTLPNNEKVPFTIAGKEFSGTFSSKKAIPGDELKACGKKGTLSIVASDTKGENTGGAAVEFEIDHCPPTVKLESPPIVKPGLPAPVYIGHVPIKGTISDGRWQSGKLSWRVQNSADPPTLIKELPKAGPFDAELDRAHEDSAHLEIVINGVDLSGNATEVVAPVSVLRQPSFLGNTDDNDQFPFAVVDAVTLDVNEDGVLDVIEGGPNGIVTRFGLKVVPATGGDPKATGRFESPADAAKNKLSRVEAAGEKKLDVTKLLVTDLDKQGKDHADDLVAIGTLGGTPALIALLHIRLVEQLAIPDKPGEKKQVISFGYRPVAFVALDEPALTGEVADLDQDGRDDYIVSASSDNKGLVVILGLKDPLCKIGADFKPCDPATEDKVSEIQVFKEKLLSPDNKGLSAISSIAIGDFWADDKSLPDVCVGDAKRPYISCYRNVAGDGKFAQPIDAYYVPDSPDAKMILKVEFSAPGGNDGPDLILATTKGLVRWLRGTHQGTFKYDISDPKLLSRTLLGFTDLRQLGVGAVGPNNAQYLILVEGGREVTVVPIALTDNSFVTACFRSWIMGGSIIKTIVGDYDEDGFDDIMAVDNAPMGVPVWNGLGQGDFRAPRVHHLCAVSAELGFAVHEIVKAAVVDVVDDKKPELFAVGKASLSVYAPLAGGPQPIFTGGCGAATPGAPPIPFPVWTLHMWWNADGAPGIVPRVAEFSPNSGSNVAKSGANTDCAAGTVDSFGTVTGLAFGDLDNDKNLDFAAVRSDSEYFVGVSTPPSKCPDCQTFSSLHEIDNDYGGENSDDPPTGTGLCCRNYRSDDKDKKNPLKGYGQGAALKRASLFTFLSGKDKTKPFKLDISHTTNKPLIIGADFAQAAGVNPVDVAIAEYNGDGKPDVAVVMKTNGSASDASYFEHRMRFFKGEGNAKLTSVPFSGDYRIWLDIKSGVVSAQSKVEYRVLSGAPSALRVAPYGAKGLAGLFVIEALNNKATPFLQISGSEGPLKAALGDGIVVGDAVQACGVRDFNDDNVSDVLCASSNAIGYCAGDKSGEQTGFLAKINLVEDAVQMVDAEIADINQDKFPDLILLSKDKSLVKLYLGDGTGGFAAYGGELRALNEVTELHAADLDANGCIDIVTTSKHGLTVLRNIGCDK